jgi:sec-independent protein translocase protein TatC
MSLRLHLREVRKRLTRSAAAVIVAAIGGWFLSDLVLDAMRDPVAALGSSGHHMANLNFTSISGAFDLKFEIALTAGVILASPVWLYQLFAFVSPGLTRREKKYTFGFFFAALPLFLFGCASGWYVLPHIVGVMLSFASPQDATLIDARGYYGFVLKLVLVIGLAFLLPVLLVALNFLGIVSGKALKKAWRFAILAIILFTAIATPSADVVSMFLLAIPMVMLYVVAVAIAWAHDGRVARLAASLSDSNEHDAGVRLAEDSR